MAHATDALHAGRGGGVEAVVAVIGVGETVELRSQFGGDVLVSGNCFGALVGELRLPVARAGGGGEWIVAAERFGVGHAHGIVHAVVRRAEVERIVEFGETIVQRRAALLALLDSIKVQIRLRDLRNPNQAARRLLAIAGIGAKAQRRRRPRQPPAVAQTVHGGRAEKIVVVERMVLRSEERSVVRLPWQEAHLRQIAQQLLLLVARLVETWTLDAVGGPAKTAVAADVERDKVRMINRAFDARAQRGREREILVRRSRAVRAHSFAQAFDFRAQAYLRETQPKPSRLLDILKLRRRIAANQHSRDQQQNETLRWKWPVHFSVGAGPDFSRPLRRGSRPL